MEFKSDQAKTWLEDENGKQIALLDHPEVRPGVVNIVHTEVDPSLGGQGIAGKITQAVAEELREKGLKAELSCSYAIRWFAKHPFMNTVRIAVITFKLRASWVHSLKEKRMIVKSLISKLQNRYHVSAAEIDEQDVHQIIVIGVAAIVPNNAMADSLMDDISFFVEDNTEAEIIFEEREIR